MGVTNLLAILLTALSSLPHASAVARAPLCTRVGIFPVVDEERAMYKGESMVKNFHVYDESANETPFGTYVLAGMDTATYPYYKNERKATALYYLKGLEHESQRRDVWAVSKHAGARRELLLIVTNSADDLASAPLRVRAKQRSGNTWERFLMQLHCFTNVPLNQWGGTWQQPPFTELWLWKQEGQLFFSNGGSHQARHHSALHLMRMAVEQGNLTDFKRVVLLMGDNPCSVTKMPADTLAVFGYSTTEECSVQPFPSYLFYRWSEANIADYAEAVRQVRSSGLAKPRSRKAGWIGNPFSNIGTRFRLVELGSLHKDLLDIRTVSPPAVGYENSPKGYMTMSEQVRKWTFLIDVAGEGFSCRLPLLLHSRRLVFIQQDGFSQWFSKLFKPWKHFVPISHDLSDLVEKVSWARENSAKASTIAENAYELSGRVLKREHAVNYIAQVISELVEKDTTDSCLS